MENKHGGQWISGQSTDARCCWPGGGGGAIFTPPEEIQRKFVRPRQFLELYLLYLQHNRLSLIMGDLIYLLQK